MVGPPMVPLGATRRDSRMRPPPSQASPTVPSDDPDARRQAHHAALAAALMAVPEAPRTQAFFDPFDGGEPATFPRAAKTPARRDSKPVAPDPCTLPRVSSAAPKVSTTLD
jgi:hypothetical protein